MIKFYTADKVPRDCQECPYFHYHLEQRCGLCDDHLPHYRVMGEEPWDDDQVRDCPLESLQEHDVEVTRQVCKKIVEYITKAEVQHDDV